MYGFALSQQEYLLGAVIFILLTLDTFLLVWFIANRIPSTPKTEPPEKNVEALKTPTPVTPDLISVLNQSRISLDFGEFLQHTLKSTKDLTSIDFSKSPLKETKNSAILTILRLIQDDPHLKSWKHLPPAAEIPRNLKQLIHADLVKDRQLTALDFSKISDEDTQKATTLVLERLLQQLASEIPSWVDKNSLLKEMLDDTLGLGPLEDLLRDEYCNEIMVNGWDKVFVEKEGKIALSAKKFIDNENVLNVIRRILAPIGRRIDESTPMVDARLKDKSRINAIIAPLSLSGPLLTIRKMPSKPFSAESLVQRGTLTPRMNQFLELCVKSRRNILLSGGTGTGKTTLLNTLALYIPQEERIVTIEDPAELKIIDKPNLASLETRPPNLEGKGGISVRQLVINALRMRPNRIIVGECRGGEAFDMLQAMNTGHEGSLTTVHANSPAEAMARLENMVLMAGMDLPLQAIREQIASGIHILVHQNRFEDGTRKITHISEIQGLDELTLKIHDIFIYDFLSKQHRSTGALPLFYHKILELEPSAMNLFDE
jgi:pilus assembly protein CpaF